MELPKQTTLGGAAFLMSKKNINIFGKFKHVLKDHPMNIYKTIQPNENTVIQKKKFQIN